LELLPHKTTAKERFHALRSLVRSRRPVVSWLEQAMSRQTTTAALSAEFKEDIQRVMLRYAAECGGPLRSRQLRSALADLGYSPRTQQEKQRFAELLILTLANGDLCVAQFQELVCEVISIFRDEMLPELEEKLRTHDKDNSGTVTEAQARRILEEMGLGPRNAEERDTVAACFPAKTEKPPEQEQEQKPDQEAPPAPPPRAIGKRFTFADLSHVIEQPKLVAKTMKAMVPRIGYADVETLVTQARESLCRLRRRRFLQIKAEFDIPPKVAEALDHELCDLKAVFDAADTSKRNKLTHEEAQSYLLDVGIRISSATMRQVAADLIEKLDDGTGHLTFASCLVVVGRLRECFMHDWRQPLKAVFERMDTERHGYLSLQECSRLLSELNMNPHTREQQRLMAVLFDVWDCDGSGRYNFQTFEVLFQRISEMMVRMSHKDDFDVEGGLEALDIFEDDEGFDSDDEDALLSVVALRCARMQARLP